VLVSAGADPSAFVGALLPPELSDGVAATARIGQGEAFVVEADEYAANFAPYRPAVAILTSAEWDHPDVFADASAVGAAFETWLRGMPVGGTLVANVADPGVAAIVERIGSAFGGQLRS
jgi:UDP-N-acetylmuramate--alanine ligase